MIDWNAVRARQERYQDLLHDAEKYRLTRQVLAGRETHNRFYCRAQIWLGRQLVTWGWRLQKHHGVVVEAFALQAGNQNQ
jgi:hypothetical protein